MIRELAAVAKIAKDLIVQRKNDDHTECIFFITSTCNLRCEFCFYRNQRNITQDMTIKEIETAFSRIGGIKSVTLSGGEPMIRKDFMDVIGVLVNKGVRSFVVPSNGFATDVIMQRVVGMLAMSQIEGLLVSISLDGPEHVHDRLRGNAGSYKNATETITKLEGLQRKYSKFSLNINTVITPDNIAHIPDLISHVDALALDRYDHSFEIVRPTQISESPPSFPDLQELRSVYNKILNYKDRIYRRKIRSNNAIAKLVLSAMHYANIYTLYKLQFDFFTKKKKWPSPCLAGSNRSVLYSNGDLAICELRPSFANIKNIPIGTSVNDLLEKESSQAKNCYCTHLCYVLLSLYKTKRIVFISLPLRALRYFFVKCNVLPYF